MEKYYEILFFLVIVALIGAAFVFGYKLLKSIGAIGKEVGETAYGKNEDTIPQSSATWASMLNEGTKNPFSPDFVGTSNIPSSDDALNTAKQLNDEIDAFWSISFITHHGDNIVNIIQALPTQTYIHEVAQAYKSEYKRDLASDIAINVVGDALNALAKVIMTKPL